MPKTNKSPLPKILTRTGTVIVDYSDDEDKHPLDIFMDADSDIESDGYKSDSTCIIDWDDDL
jgi:hypothetical protein